MGHDYAAGKTGKLNLTSSQWLASNVNTHNVQLNDNSLQTVCLFLDPSQCKDKSNFSTGPVEKNFYQFIYQNIIEVKEGKKVEFKDMHSFFFKKSTKGKKVAKYPNMMKFVKLRKRIANGHFNAMILFTQIVPNDLVKAKIEIDNFFIELIGKNWLGKDPNDILAAHKECCVSLLEAPTSMMDLGNLITKTFKEVHISIHHVLSYAIKISGKGIYENSLEILLANGITPLSEEVLSITKQTTIIENLATIINAELKSDFNVTETILLFNQICFYSMRKHCDIDCPELYLSPMEFDKVLQGKEFSSHIALREDIMVNCSYDYECGNKEKNTLALA